MDNEELLDYYELLVLSALAYRKQGEEELANIDGRIATEILRRMAKD